MAEHNELGKLGEDIARKFLLKKGNELLKRNYRFGRHEVDMILFDGKEIVVVEVKTRSSPFMAGPEKTVTKKKQRSMIKVAQFFMDSEERDEEVRFDIVSVLIQQDKQEIEHIEDAFYPTI